MEICDLQNLALRSDKRSSQTSNKVEVLHINFPRAQVFITGVARHFISVSTTDKTLIFPGYFS